MTGTSYSAFPILQPLLNNYSHESVSDYFHQEGDEKMGCSRMIEESGTTENSGFEF